MCVVCSAGVGRTGTLITIDIALEQVKAEGVVGIYNVVDKMRHQRPHMIQSQVCIFKCLKHNYNLMFTVMFITGAVHVHS